MSNFAWYNRHWQRPLIRRSELKLCLNATDEAVFIAIPSMKAEIAVFIEWLQSDVCFFTKQVSFFVI